MACRDCRNCEFGSAAGFNYNGQPMARCFNERPTRKVNAYTACGKCPNWLERIAGLERYDERLRDNDYEMPAREDRYGGPREYEPDWFERAQYSEEARLLDMEEAVDRDPNAGMSKSWWLWLGRPDPAKQTRKRPVGCKTYKLPPATAAAYLSKKYGTRLRKFA